MATLLKILPDGKYEFMEGGARSESIKFNGDGTHKIVGHTPIVGCCMLVGSVTARSYSDRDFWITTEVLEILENTDDVVKFKTKNSIYEWRG